MSRGARRSAGSRGVTVGSFALARTNSGPTVLLGLAGLIVGPSTGHWYVGEVGGLGILARLGSAVLIAKGIIASDNEGCESFSDSSECAAIREEEDEGERMVYAGVALWAGATLYDVVTSYTGVSRWNREHALQVAPVAFGARAPGVALSVRF